VALAVLFLVLRLLLLPLLALLVFRTAFIGTTTTFIGTATSAVIGLAFGLGSCQGSAAGSALPLWSWERISLECRKVVTASAATWASSISLSAAIAVRARCLDE